MNKEQREFLEKEKRDLKSTQNLQWASFAVALFLALFFGLLVPVLGVAVFILALVLAVLAATKSNRIKQIKFQLMGK